MFTHLSNLQPIGAIIAFNVLQIIFEAQRGGGVGGEIVLDNVVLTSGPCQEDDSPVF